jgi:hypothetical protein
MRGIYFKLGFDNNEFNFESKLHWRRQDDIFEIFTRKLIKPWEQLLTFQRYLLHKGASEATG